MDKRIDEKIISICFSSKGFLNYKKIYNLSEEDIIYLNNRFEYIESIKEGLFRLKNNIEIRPTCKICGSNVKFYGKINHPYSDCCCQKCADEYRQIKIKETSLLKYGVDHPAKSAQSIQKHQEYYRKNNIKEKLHNAIKEKYGVDNVFQLDSVKEKIIQKSINKYGTKYPNQSEKVKNKIKKSNQKKYGYDYGFQSPIIKDKIKEKNLSKYGVDNPAKSEIIKEKTKKTDSEKYNCEYHITSQEIREKSKITIFNHYGVDHPFKSKEVQQKIKNTNLEKYGSEYYLGSKEFNEKISKILKEVYHINHDDIIGKRIQTNLKKYGIEFYTQSEKFRYNMSILMQSPQMREQIYNTHKKNNSFKTSKAESELYQLLKEKYPNVKYQYKSEVYPFVCDFYIPELNLYIEYNGTWTHGKHPFNSNDENDINIVNLWKEKNTKYYNNAIINWTIRDVLKRNIAKENNLNYIELWNLKEAKEYILSL